MDEFVRNHQKIVFETTLNALEKNGFKAFLVSSKEEAAKKIMEIAKDCSTVGIAGTILFALWTCCQNWNRLER